MKVIIAGSRNIPDYNATYTMLYNRLWNLHWKITEVVSGGADGADQIGERYAAIQSIPVKRFLPDWDTHGKAAGPIRNALMASYADALIALWDGKSRGTENMIQEAMKRQLKVEIVKI